MKKYLEGCGAWFVKYFANGFTKSGVPDVLACVNGYFVGVESKAQNGKPSELQIYNVRKINEAGGFAFILYPSAFDKFKRFIDDLTRDVYDREQIPEIWR